MNERDIAKRARLAAAYRFSAYDFMRQVWITRLHAQMTWVLGDVKLAAFVRVVAAKQALRERRPLEEIFDAAVQVAIDCANNNRHSTYRFLMPKPVPSWLKSLSFLQSRRFGVLDTQSR